MNTKSHSLHYWSNIRNNIFIEPSQKTVRPFLIEYILKLTSDAQNLTENELLRGAGHGIGMDICGALAWHSASNIENSGWLNKESEPLLYELLVVSGTLDIDANNKDAWIRLFSIVEELYRTEKNLKNAV